MSPISQVQVIGHYEYFQWAFSPRILFSEVLPDADQMPVLVADIKIAAAIVLIFDGPVDCHAALLQLGIHGVDVVDTNVERPVLVERDRMWRAGLVEDLLPCRARQCRTSAAHRRIYRG
jgi:hypothetical protein